MPAPCKANGCALRQATKLGHHCEDPHRDTELHEQNNCIVLYQFTYSEIAATKQ